MGEAENTHKNKAKTEARNLYKETVSTVNGFVPLSKLTTVLPHEHIMFCPLPDKYAIAKPKIHPFLNTNEFLINRGHLRMHPYTTLYDDSLGKYTYGFYVKQRTIGELIKCKQYVSTIVENTSYGLKRNIFELKSISQACGVDIIVGTGFYGANVQRTEILSWSEKSIYELMRKDLTENCSRCPKVEHSNQTQITDKILAGFIGAVGISSPIHEFEKRSIRATGQLQAQLRCPVSFSPSMGSCDYNEVLRIYQEAGGKTEKVVLTHLDCMSIKKKEFIKFVNDTDCYIQLSMFGNEWSFNHKDDYYDMLSDAQRIKRLKQLKNENKLHRVLISHDIHTENRLECFGGHGYTHISKNIKRNMQIKNLESDDFEVITCENPKKWLFWNQECKI